MKLKHDENAILQLACQIWQNDHFVLAYQPSVKQYVVHISYRIEHNLVAITISCMSNRLWATFSLSQEETERLSDS